MQELLRVAGVRTKRSSETARRVGDSNMDKGKSICAMRTALGCPHRATNRIGQLNAGEALSRSCGFCRMPHGVTAGAIRVSILSVGAVAFHFIQGVDSR
jgi:hypothetical protein